MKKVRLKELFKLSEDPKYLAKGFALGSFVGMLPIPGFQALVSLTIASILKVHKTAAVTGVFNTNVATGAFMFGFNYWVGKTILGYSPNFEFPKKISFDFITIILDSGKEVFLSMLVGGVISGVFFAVGGYYLALYLVSRNKKNL